VAEQHLVERFDGADVVPLMTTDEARACVTSINSHMNSARAELLRLYEGRGWAALGYASWRECVATEFAKSQAYLYRQLEAAEIEQRISPMGEIGAVSERQLRPLARLTPIEQPAAWQRAQEIAAEDGERLTSRHVEQAVREWRSDDQSVFTDPQADAYAAQVEQRAGRVNAGLFTSATPEWYTPDHIIARVIQVFGQIDLDPCSNSNDPNVANVLALNYWTIDDNGLAQPWHGNVYMNPPYGDEIPGWVGRLIGAKETGEIIQGIALLPARTDTAWFQPLFDYPICFVRGRLRFSGAENSAPFPSAVVYLGPDLLLFQDAFEDIGRIK
jgi:hypothetical protein